MLLRAITVLTLLWLAARFSDADRYKTRPETASSAASNGEHDLPLQPNLVRLLLYFLTFA